MTNKLLGSVRPIVGQEYFPRLGPVQLVIAQPMTLATDLLVFNTYDQIIAYAELQTDYQTPVFPWERPKPIHVMDVVSGDKKDLIGYVDGHWQPCATRGKLIQVRYGNRMIDGVPGFDLEYEGRPRVYVTYGNETTDVDRHVYRLLVTILLADEAHRVTQKIWQDLLRETQK